MTNHRISCRAFTVHVGVDEAGVIREAAPFIRRFIGQPLANLLRWAEGFGGLEHHDEA